MLGCLVVLIATFFFLTLYSILQANLTLLPDEVIPYLSVKVLDTSTAATLFASLMGAMLLRHQFALGLLPRINYKSAKGTRKDSDNPEAFFLTWRVEILNSGLGAAIVNSTDYCLELSGGDEGRCTGGHKDIINQLTLVNLVRDQDYWLENITTGFALSPKDGCPIFEIKQEHLAKIQRLDMMLYFQDQLGGKYRREIFLVPHQPAALQKQDG